MVEKVVQAVAQAAHQVVRLEEPQAAHREIQVELARIRQVPRPHNTEGKGNLSLGFLFFSDRV